MTALKLFGALLLLIPSTGAGIALLLVLLALGLLGLSLLAPLRARLDSAARARVDRVGLISGLAVLGALLAGLRLEPTAYLAEGGLPALRLLAAALTSLGLGALVATAAMALAGVARQLPSRDVVSPVVTTGRRARVLRRARVELEQLRVAVQRLESSYQDARARAERENDASVVDSYQRTASAIADKLEMGQQLVRAATRGVLQLVCRDALEAVLVDRPDRQIAEVGERDRAGKPIDRQLAATLNELERYVERIKLSLWLVRDEIDGAPGSLAGELETTAGEDAAPVRQALEEMLTSYQRARHQLEALRLRHRADAGADAAVAAASKLALHGDRVSTSPEPGALALEIAQTEAAAERALELAPARADELSAAVGRATTLLDGDDETTLGEVLRAMRELSSPRR